MVSKKPTIRWVLLGLVAALIVYLVVRSMKTKETYRSYVEHGKSDYPGGDIAQYDVFTDASRYLDGQKMSTRKRCMEMCDLPANIEKGCVAYALSRKATDGVRECKLKDASALTTANRKKGAEWNTYILRDHYNATMRNKKKTYLS